VEHYIIYFSFYAFSYWYSKIRSNFISMSAQSWLLCLIFYKLARMCGFCSVQVHKLAARVGIPRVVRNMEGSAAPGGSQEGTCQGLSG